MQGMPNKSAGGISFLSRRHGWAFDNVRNFEVRDVQDVW